MHILTGEQVHTERLCCTEAQKLEIEALYAGNKETVKTFGDSDYSQNQAQQLLENLGLPIVYDGSSQRSPGQKWMVAWSTKWKARKNDPVPDVNYRVLYQW